MARGKATGGNGGNASTGNKQFGNGNSFAYSPSQRQDSQSRQLSCGCNPQHSVSSQGGNTSASSGNAYGGNGGNATAGNLAGTWQGNTTGSGMPLTV